jgi:hypothetical protein
MEKLEKFEAVYKKLAWTVFSPLIDEKINNTVFTFALEKVVKWPTEEELKEKSYLSMDGYLSEEEKAIEVVSKWDDTPSNMSKGNENWNYIKWCEDRGLIEKGIEWESDVAGSGDGDLIFWRKGKTELEAEYVFRWYCDFESIENKVRKELENEIFREFDINEEGEKDEYIEWRNSSKEDPFGYKYKPE